MIERLRIRDRGTLPCIDRVISVLPTIGLCASLLAGSALPLAAYAESAATTKSHAVTIRALPKYPPDFTHVEYVNPNAPKGGKVKLAEEGSFDSLNPFILKGNPAAGLGLTFETLTSRAYDEAATDYGLLAHTIETPEDLSWVAFHLRREARFHDGTPVTPDDVIFSFEMLKTKGHPFYRAYYKDVVSAEPYGEWGVKFSFAGRVNQELPAIVGQLSVVSKAFFETHEFDKTTLEPILGSGPYRVARVEAGRSIVYERVGDYWGENIPIRKGTNNFDEIRYDYYRDSTVILEAFKAGEFDFRQENTSKLWATAYDGTALEKGWVEKKLIPHQRPAGMQGFIFNTRRSYFSDRRVREALSYAFDFEWTNKNLFYGQYARSYSYFTNSELAATMLASDVEKSILAPYAKNLPTEVLTQVYTPPVTGKRGIRGNLRKARALLEAAGWTIQDQVLKNAAGKAFEFEFLLRSPTFERIALPYQRNLERLGIKMKVRTVDTAQYKKRLDDFDFDMLLHGFGQSLSPGNEQRDFWHSASADVKGSRNIIGIRDPAVDGLIDLIIEAPDRQSLIERTRALDRVLLWGHYVVPNWHINAYRVAYWNKFGRPAVTPDYTLGFQTWWVDPAKVDAINKHQGRTTKQ